MISGYPTDEAPGGTLLACLRLMTRVRAFEAFCIARRAAGEVLGNTFPSLGQEGLCAAGLALDQQDVLFPSYRSRPLVFAKGVGVDEHFAELVGSADSRLQGREVFHHASWPAKGVMPGSSMIGGWLPMAAGYALTQSLQNAGAVTLCAFGDGSFGAGDFHEAVNIIAVWKLPVVLLCENNGYQVSARWDTMRASRAIGEYLKPHGYRVIDVDGNDAEAVFSATREARSIALEGQPVLVECFTYRMGGYSSHIGEPRKGHEADLAEWRTRDPILVARKRALDRGLADTKALDAMAAEETASIERAWARFRASAPEIVQ